jgi:predicted glycoside hydrolase/deacetylase ChbG (UPF0249 family)
MGRFQRKLIVVADDYGIGPEVSRGILELLGRGSVTSTVLLVNSPFAEDGVRQWNDAGSPGEMGWHPNLTMDGPIASPDAVRSLLNRDGQLVPLGTLLFRLATGRLHYAHVVNELEAQYRRCRDLLGQPPALVNGHKHIHVFPMVSRALIEVLQRSRVRPYIRRVVEPLSSWLRVPGARIKRAFLATLGRLAGRRFDRGGFPGNDVLAGITDPKWVHDSCFFARWLERIPERFVELMVHPGYRDETLIGRDCTPTDGQIERRVAEMRLLMDPEFEVSCHRSGFALCPVDRELQQPLKESRNAA